MFNEIQNSLDNNHALVSVIVPSFNPGNKITRSVNSLRRLMKTDLIHEVLFVDDCSHDGTYEWLENICADYENWQVFSTPKNSGTPSVPRNLGISKAKGNYVFFLDCDDEIIEDNFVSQAKFASANASEIVRSPLIVLDRRGRSLLNVIDDDFLDLPKKEKIKSIISKQSTTNSTLVKREFLLDHKLQWPVGNHTGEDTLFLVSILAAAEQIDYFDEPTIVYHKTASSVLSTTQRYGSRELSSHLSVWKIAEKELNTFGISYLELRGSVAIGYALRTLIRYGVGEIGELEFREFSAFTQKFRKTIEKLDFNSRVRSIVRSLLDGNYDEFISEIKPRLLVAGYDLKFILGAIPSLEARFNIKIDEWTGHESHNESASRELLAWADIVFCEWMLGNAVWYSKNKLPNQLLFVRLHRFETTRSYGHQIDKKKVDAFISVSVETLEDMIRTFSLDRTKCRLIPNFLDIDRYKKSDDAERFFNLALVGAIPARKGLLDSLKLLRQLRMHDSRYTLTLFGKQLAELPWVANDPNERAYFNRCDRFIEDHQLEDAVTHGGWVSTEQEIKDYGFVLSTSNAESFHVAPAEAFIVGNQGLFLGWPGVEFIYPEKYIFSNVEEMAKYILSQKEVDNFNSGASLGKEYVTANYSLVHFAKRISDLVLEV